RTSRLHQPCHRRPRLLRAGEVELAAGLDEVDLRVDVPEDRASHQRKALNAGSSRWRVVRTPAQRSPWRRTRSSTTSIVHHHPHARDRGPARPPRAPPPRGDRAPPLPPPAPSPAAKTPGAPPLPPLVHTPPTQQRRVPPRHDLAELPRVRVGVAPFHRHEHMH